MKIKEFDPYIKENDKMYEDEILDTEFSKEGLSEFHKKYPDKYLFVVLLDKSSATVFDKSGTFPGDNDGDGVSYDPTGAYVDNRDGRKVSPEKVVRVLADVDNVFDYINYFENNINVEKIKRGI